MSLSIGIIGLPIVDKPTLFNALTGTYILVANYPFAIISKTQGETMQPQEQTQVTSQTTPAQQQQQQQQHQPYMQSRVQYHGRTYFSGGLGLLEWSADNHIRLFELDPATGQSKGIVFDCLPNQIQKAKVVFSYMKLRINGKLYQLDFSQTSTNWLMAGGLLGLWMSKRKADESGLSWWTENLKNQGVITN